MVLFVPCLGINVVADIVDKLFPNKPCVVTALNATTLVQRGPITHSSTGPKPDSCHRPCNIPSDIRLSAYAWQSGPPFPSPVISIECGPICLKLLMRSWILASYFPEIKPGGYFVPL